MIRSRRARSLWNLACDTASSWLVDSRIQETISQQTDSGDPQRFQRGRTWKEFDRSCLPDLKLPRQLQNCVGWSFRSVDQAVGTHRFASIRKTLLERHFFERKSFACCGSHRNGQKRGGSYDRSLGSACPNRSIAPRWNSSVFHVGTCCKEPLIKAPTELLRQDSTCS